MQIDNSFDSSDKNLEKKLKKDHEDIIRWSTVHILPHTNVKIFGICERGIESDGPNFIFHIRREHGKNPTRAQN